MPDIRDDFATLHRTARETRRSRLPARDCDRDEVIGVLRTKDLIAAKEVSDTPDIRSPKQISPVVADTSRALDVIKALRASTVHMALVFDEHGNFEGLVLSAEVLHPTRLVPTIRPDGVLNPAMPDFGADVARLGEITGADTARMSGCLDALRQRRAHFKAHGATATDHDIPDLMTVRPDPPEAQALLSKALAGTIDTSEAIRFHNRRSSNAVVRARFGRDVGADIPHRVDWVDGLSVLLNRVGNERSLHIIAFTLDESAYAREPAPMAGHWPALRVGPPWWFHDSPNGIARYFDQVAETAGYRNLAGFSNDTRALLSIPARHDMWRRAVARHLAGQIGAGRFGMADAEDLAPLLAQGLARDAYKLDAA